MNHLREAWALRVAGSWSPKATVPSTNFDFGSQVGQFPPDGPEGISYFKGEAGAGAGKHVDCLLYRRAGKLVGVLYHYPFDFPPYEVRGNVNVMVDPGHQRSGIGSQLLAEAEKRWPLDWQAQSYTEEGAALLRSHVNR
jgi:GNAT superfamily N-acetyltransferase